MDWIGEIGRSWLGSLERLALLSVVFAVLSRLMPCNPGMHFWKDLRGLATDLVYWFCMPMVFHVGRTAMLVVGVLLLFGGREPSLLPVKGWPVWQQCLAVFVIQDVLLYWVHRAFHSRVAWKFHAIHHSPRTLDWLSMTRFHPVNSLLEFALADVFVVLLGFPAAAVVTLAPFNIIYSAMVHANLNWTFGPLKYVLASPVFHRWHHTMEKAGRDKNFAATFPFLDLMFGTFYMPLHRLPENFGVDENDVPAGFWGQMLYPFRSGEAAKATRSAVAARTKTDADTPEPRKQSGKAA
ncbi:MAG: sterol desaturase family protein [Planctomycetia bacterium]|nr:sterol desaturase family protein [Planctomycetia bacterium]